MRARAELLLYSFSQDPGYCDASTARDGVGRPVSLFTVLLGSSEICELTYVSVLIGRLRDKAKGGSRSHSSLLSETKLTNSCV